jgi:hypothetical protein
MEKMLYFAEGGGADATTEAAMYPASRFLGVEPHDASNTYIYFDSPVGDVDGGGGVGDYVKITHADTHDTAGSYHRAKLIARSIAEAINSGPNSDGFVVIADADNGVYYGDIATISSDSGFAVAVTLDS